MKRALLLVAVLAAPAFISTVSAAGFKDEAAAKSDDNADPDRKICRVDRATGSRVRVNRVCLTREQWTELEEKKRKGMELMGRSGSFSPCGATGLGQGGCGGQ